MKSSLKHDILLTFLIILSIVMVMGCFLCAISNLFSSDTYSYNRTFFSSNDISLFEDMYHVKFPKGTKFVEFSGDQSSRTGDTDVQLKIKLPDSERDKFAKDWFAKQPKDNPDGSLEKYFEKNDILSMSKIYYNHSGDTVLMRFENIFDIVVKFMGSLGWFVCILIIIVTNILYERFSKKDVALWKPPD